MVTEDYAQGRISARVALTASRQPAHEMPWIEAEMHRVFGDAAGVTPTGIIYLMHRMESYLLSSQIKSFAIAFAIIALAMVLALRSLRLGLLAMIPNFLPILFVLAVMPMLGIALDVGTVMIAGVALGLIVDDTIHLLHRLDVEMRGAPDTRTALAHALRASGRPIIVTSVVLVIGFSVPTMASFNPIIHFGLLAILTVALALFFDLVVLPAIIGFLDLSPRRTS